MQRKHNILINFLFVTLFFLSISCVDNTLTTAERLMASGEFSAARKLLDNTENKSASHNRLLALSLFVEGLPDSGFVALSRSILSEEDRTESAQILFKAAVEIVREKSRSREVVRLLDSALTRNPNLKNDIMTLLWARGLEYLQVPGDAGWRLFQFANSIEPNTDNRLRGYDISLYRRYEELSTVTSILARLQSAIDEFFTKHKYKPSNIIELIQFRPELTYFANRDGWRFILDTPSGKPVAEALPKNPAGVLPKTVLKNP